MPQPRRVRRHMALYTSRGLSPTRGCTPGQLDARCRASSPDPIHDSPPEPTRVSRGLAWGTEGSVGEHRRTAHQTVEHLERVDGSPERSNLLESLAPAYGLEQEPGTTNHRPLQFLFKADSKPFRRKHSCFPEARSAPRSSDQHSHPTVLNVEREAVAVPLSN